MKKYIAAILLLIFFGTAYGEKRIATLDTNQVKSNLQTLVRLYYKRTEIDSLASFLAFPLYSKQWYGNKTWRSAKQFKQELKAILMRSKFRQTPYRVESIYQLKNKKNPAIPASNYACYQMLVHLPDIDEAGNGSYVKFTFYVAKKKPFKIIGVEQEDVP